MYRKEYITNNDVGITQKCEIIQRVMTSVFTTSPITKTDFHLKTLENITTLNCDKVQH